ncbi:DUF1554 domain-containing protein [Sorangium sp. So ce1024]|uniref:DUF1554 domain-containing protein n=1 Tax=Sorangium sp. So ce1024 TaxID=3133327 RepID=UPI003F0E6037
MERTRTEIRRHLTLVLGLSLAVAACGDDQSGDSSGTAASSSATTAASSSSSGGGGGGTGGGDGGGGDGGGGTGGGGTGGGGTGGGGGASPSLSFFVSSTGSPTGNLGGLDGADRRCQELATAVGAGARTWRAYLSVEKGPDDKPVHARDRIGTGPWYNAKLELVAANLEELHARDGDHTVFLDENGAMVPGQWAGSPQPNQHDILTGTDRDGTLKAGETCADWTSEAENMTAWVGHSDGTGPNQSTAEMYRPWNSVHQNGSCADTAPKGGNGRIYCFAAD